MTAPRNFLFDVGKVLLDFDFESSLRKLLPPDLPDAEDRLSRLLAPKDPFERGDIPLDEYVKDSLEILGHGITEEDFFAAWRNIFTPNTPMWEVVRKLQADGHGLFLFSNTNAIHCPWFIETFPIFDAFQGGTYSFVEGSMKPEPEIYRKAIGNHGLEPSRTLYIDDLPANIRTGRELGFRSHQYDLNDHPAFLTWLERELGGDAE